MSEGFDFVMGLRFSLFWQEGDNTKNCHPLKVISFEDLISLIMNRDLKDIPKIERPYFTPYGTFSYRNNNSLITYNKDLISLDYDKLTPDQVDLLNKYWSSRRSTILSMKSPSGNGLKVLLWACTGIDISQGHKVHYETLKHNISIFTIMGLEADPSQFVLSQPFFIPYNQDFYFNFHPKREHYPFTKIPTPPPAPIVLRPSRSFDSNEVNQFFLKRFEYWINWIQNKPVSEGTHRPVYTVLMNLLPFIDQQTVVSESELLQALERIVESRYGNRSEIPALYRSVKAVKQRTGGYRIEDQMTEYYSR